MDIKLRFFGAAQNVTGSCYILEVGDRTIMIDCGFYQERDLTSRNWDPFPVPPSEIDVVLLTHAHLDHCGRLPKLVKEGFNGPVMCTPATGEIARIIMLDSAHIQEEDIKHKKRRHEKEGRVSPFPYQPLYTMEDAEAVSSMIKPVPYEQEVPVFEGVTASFREAGHIFGSTNIRVSIDTGAGTKSILFSGDVGRWDLPIQRDPAPLPEADYVVCESTYGDRTHPPATDIPGELERIVNETVKAGGNLVIPSFAVERTQELLYFLSGLLEQDRIPHLMAFVDSPMAVRVTEVFRKHPEIFDETSRKLLEQGHHPCDFPGLTMSRTVAQSKAINHIQGSALIIAGSGMCTGGRIKHHLASNISRPESTVLFVGYQAKGTLGRLILDGAETVRLHGQPHEVRARIERISGFSAHADQNELLRWLDTMPKAPGKIIITHGEPESANGFAEFLKNKRGWDSVVPAYQDVIVL